MCAAEAIKCIEAETDSFKIESSGPGYVIASFDEKYLQPIADRISLSHRIGRYYGSFDLNETEKFNDIEIPEGSFAVKGKRFEGMMADIDSQDLVRKLGTALSKNNDVNLKNPDLEIVMLMSDKVHVYLSEKTIDRNILETRKVGERPFFSPISLHPRFARAAINLTGVKKGEKLLDPFCGTGGIVIEAAFMGMKALASDFDQEMISGTLENMDYYGLKIHDYDVIDISKIQDRFGEVDAICTDPPYGRSTCTGGEDIESIYARAMKSFEDILKPGGTATIVLPHPIESKTMKLESMYIQRVHGSLSRHYHTFRKQLL